MGLLHLDAEIEDLLGVDDTWTDERIRKELRDTQLYLGNAFNCEVGMMRVNKYVQYVLEIKSYDQARAICELLGMFTMFNAKTEF